MAHTKGVQAEMVGISGVYGLFEIGAWLYCSWQQMMTTHDSIVGMLQGGTLPPEKMTTAELLIFLQGNLPKYNSIAWFVAVVTQIVYMGAALSAGPVGGKFLHRAIIVVFFILEVITDLWYSVATNTTLGGAIVWVFNWGNGGWLVSLCYIAAMSAGSIFLGIRGFYRLGKVVKLMMSEPRLTETQQTKKGAEA